MLRITRKDLGESQTKKQFLFGLSTQIFKTGKIQTKNGTQIFKTGKIQTKIREIQTSKKNRFLFGSPHFFCLDFPDFRKNLENPNTKIAKSKHQKSSFFIVWISLFLFFFRFLIYHRLFVPLL
jgi:hypothetical protein